MRGARDCSDGALKRWMLRVIRVCLRLGHSARCSCGSYLARLSSGNEPNGVASDRRLLAVLPFRNPGRPGDACFAVGVTEEVTRSCRAVPSTDHIRDKMKVKIR